MSEARGIPATLLVAALDARVRRLRARQALARISRPTTSLRLSIPRLRWTPERFSSPVLAWST